MGVDEAAMRRILTDRRQRPALAQAAAMRPRRTHTGGALAARGQPAASVAAAEQEPRQPAAARRQQRQPRPPPAPAARPRARTLRWPCCWRPRVAAAQAVPQPGWLPRPVAELQALDEVSARVSVFPARWGRRCASAPWPSPCAPATPARATRCRTPPPGSRCATKRAGPDAPPAFRGWMFASAPAVNMLEHPVYDVRILACR